MARECVDRIGFISKENFMAQYISGEDLLKAKTVGYIPVDILEGVARNMLDDVETIIKGSFVDSLMISEWRDRSGVVTRRLHDSIYNEFDALCWFKDLVNVIVNKDKLGSIRTREKIEFENRLRESMGHPPLSKPEFKFVADFFYPGNVKMTAIFINDMTADSGGHVKYGSPWPGCGRAIVPGSCQFRVGSDATGWSWKEVEERPILEPLITEYWPKRKIANKLCKALNQVMENFPALI